MLGKSSHNLMRRHFGSQEGKTLLELGYPELAAGDFERTLILIDHARDDSSKLGGKVRQNIRDAWS